MSKSKSSEDTKLKTHFNQYEKHRLLCYRLFCSYKKSHLSGSIMIAKIVPIKSLRKSNFTALVNYLTDTKGTSERVGRITATNCFTDELTASLLEIQNTQAMNARARSDKTFHLILSFPENERLSDTDFSAIVVRFCDALGFQNTSASVLCMKTLITCIFILRSTRFIPEN